MKVGLVFTVKEEGCVEVVRLMGLVRRSLRVLEVSPKGVGLSVSQAGGEGTVTIGMRGFGVGFWFS